METLLSFEYLVLPLAIHPQTDWKNNIAGDVPKIHLEKNVWPTTQTEI